MAATTTLSTTTLSRQVVDSDGAIEVASTSGIVPGVRLFVDRELMGVLRLGLGSSVTVLRGVDGTARAAHAPGVLVTIGRGDQFYANDPVGRPPDPVLVSPWINVLTGAIWYAQGDEAGPGLQNRYWLQQTAAHPIGALGVRESASTTP